MIARAYSAALTAASSFVWGAIERRLSRVLGMDVALARDVVATARQGSDGGLLLRCAALCAATTRFAPRVAPRALRERVIDSAMIHVPPGVTPISEVPSEGALDLATLQMVGRGVLDEPV